MFYVNDEPEGKFLYTETIKLYCTFTVKNTKLSIIRVKTSTGTTTMQKR